MTVALQHHESWEFDDGIVERADVSDILFVEAPELVAVLAHAADDSPVAFVDATGRVAAVNGFALRRGVRPSMSVEAVTARGVAAVAGDTPEGYDTAFERILDWLHPLDVDVEFAGPDALFIALRAGSATNAAYRVAQRIRSRLSECASSGAAVGIGPNKVVARMASRLDEDGISIVRDDAFLETFGSEPVQDLIGVASETSRRLAGLGVFTIAQLARANADELEETFGAVGHVLLARARGMDDTPVVSQVAVSSSGDVGRRRSDEATTGFLAASPSVVVGRRPGQLPRMGRGRGERVVLSLCTPSDASSDGAAERTGITLPALES